MSAVDTWSTVFEIAVVFALIYGLFRQEKIVEFENRTARAIRAYVRARKAGQNKHLNDLNKLS